MFKRNKPDEMEQDIKNKSIITSYQFTETLLFVWFVICMVRRQSAIVPLYLLITQNIVRFISEIILKRSVGDDRWKKSLIAFISVFLVIIFIVLVSAATFVAHGGTE